MGAQTRLWRRPAAATAGPPPRPFCRAAAAAAAAAAGEGPHWTGSCGTGPTSTPTSRCGAGGGAVAGGEARREGGQEGGGTVGSAAPDLPAPLTASFNEYSTKAGTRAQVRGARSTLSLSHPNCRPPAHSPRSLSLRGAGAGAAPAASRGPSRPCAAGGSLSTSQSRALSQSVNIL